MCQSVVNKNTARKGKNLGFVLKPSERGGEDKAVIVPLKLRTVFLTLFVKLFHAETLS
jgi:hypothetical protein